MKIYVVEWVTLVEYGPRRVSKKFMTLDSANDYRTSVEYALKILKAKNVSVEITTEEIFE